VIDNLERDGFVRRERSLEDRRVIHVHLTEAGRRQVEAVMPGHIAALVDEFSVLSETELESFACMCKKLGKGKEPQP
jgi:MarR family 2-MHQ and catechol resistance regulon transcriptional repressor